MSTEPDEAGCPPALKASRHERIAVLGAVVLLALAALVLGLVLAPAATRLLLGLMVAAVFVLGKFLPLVAIEEPTFTFYELGVVIWIMDTVTVLVLVYAMEILYRWRRPARLIRGIQDRAGLVLDAFPSMRRFAFVGLVMFVLFPVSGTGAIAGTFLGVLLGFHRWRIVAAVCLGGCIGGLGMAFLAERFGRAIEGYRNDPWIIAGLALLLVGALLALNLAYRRALRRRRER